MWPRSSHRGLGDVLLASVMAMMAQSEHRKTKANREDVETAMERLGFQRRLDGDSTASPTAFVKDDGTALTEADWRRLEETLVVVAAERREREAEVERRRLAYEAKVNAEWEAARKAEYDAVAAPYREQRRLRNIAKMKHREKGTNA
jgi:hypothetical protein